MDSLTQITLGAAVGEAVLGKKVGNRAMLWGAIAGTFPDLDVVANVVTDEISALAFHRAITHSLAFAAVAPLAMGWLVHRLYLPRDTRGRFRKDLAIVWLGLMTVIGLGSIWMPIELFQTAKIALAVGTTMIALVIVVYIRERRRRTPSTSGNATMWGWAHLFFWAILTHPILDCCTTYGTQLFQPFWDYRVAFNNISVVDPLYTLPFLILLILASRWTKASPRRQLYNYLGIAMSTAYLMFTFYNKYQVNQIFESSLQREGISYERFSTYPTIFNNLLWQGLAEADNAYYHGVYSVFDSEPRVTKFTRIPKHHELLATYEEERTVQILKWFSNGYYNVSTIGDSTWHFNDLRFGSIDQSFDETGDFIFQFHLSFNQDGELIAHQRRARTPAARNALADLLQRMRGK